MIGSDRHSAGGASKRQRPRPAGFSMVELLVALCLASVLAAMSMAPLTASRDALRAEAAGRCLAAIFQAARMKAAQRGQQVGIRFDCDNAGYGWTVYADGNGNGVRSADIAGGIDVPLGGRTSMPATIPGVDFGAVAGVPQWDSAIAVGDDPIRLGSSDLLSFSPDGTSSSGTVYLMGRGGHMWAVRVLGATARIRLGHFDRARQAWVLP